MVLEIKELNEGFYRSMNDVLYKRKHDFISINDFGIIRNI